MAIGLACELVWAAAAGLHGADLGPALAGAAAIRDPARERRALTDRALGVQRLLVLRVAFAAEPGEPITSEEATGILQQASEILDRISYGRFGIRFVVSPVISLPGSREEYASLAQFGRLMTDAREAALAAGLDYRDFAFDVVFHAAVVGLGVANAQLDGRGIQLQVGANAVNLVHELCHNLGLSHANAWNTEGPPLLPTSPPLPTNSGRLKDPLSIPISPGSLLRAESASGAGWELDAGDPWDIMGLGDSDLNAASKVYLRWLLASAILDVQAKDSTNRIYAIETAHLDPGLLRALRVPGPRNGPAGPRDYGIELPPPQGGFPSAPGVLLRWIDPRPESRPESPLLLDATAGSVGGFSDAILPPGRTFSDRALGLHVTVTAAGSSVQGQWADVVIHQFDEATNRHPAVTLNLGRTEIAVGEPLRVAADLTYDSQVARAWFWDFGDGSPSTNAPEVLKSWSGAGDYVVRVEVSDLNGGVSSAQKVVRVGTVTGFRIMGRVHDVSGNPIEGAWVQTGIQAPGSALAPTGRTQTDSAGVFALVGLRPGEYPIRAFHPDYDIASPDDVVVKDADVEGISFVGKRLPQVTVGSPVVIREDSGKTNAFLLRRAGPLSEPLTVYFVLGGTATAGTDYEDPFVDHVEFPVGQAEVAVPLTLFQDAESESPETISLTLVTPGLSERLDSVGDRYTVFYPGWELEESAEPALWRRTQAPYGVGDRGEAEVDIEDVSAPMPRLSVREVDPGALSIVTHAAIGTWGSLEESGDLRLWTEVKSLEFTAAPEIATVVGKTDRAMFYRFRAKGSVLDTVRFPRARALR